MAKCFILAAFVCLLTGSAVNSLGDIDNYILNHCGSACNGESPDCRDCYNEAVDLFDQENPDSPEVDFDLHYNNGKLDLTF
ncbi:MAG: hypothetical protein K2X28_00020 [Alphaproteobacteria bacterium]|nr:hypothetical protein [Alphaproteobacteria bacterium]